MTDWADEAVDELCKEFGFDEGKGLDMYDKALVSQALRAAELRGRVAGLTIAKEIVEKADFQDDIFHEICNIINKLTEELK